MGGDGVILFTAFEPSGDRLAAPVIRALRAARTGIEIWALGGPRMQDAGAQMIDQTTADAAMLLSAVGRVGEHRRVLRKLRQWMANHPLNALVPVDSPAANWSICKMARRSHPDVQIVHLAAPQLWAWGAWRISKLRRLTDHVLCLLPFEPQWFSTRGVRATFVGHPLFTNPPEGYPPPADTHRAFDEVDQPKLGLLPGSRRQSEVCINWPTMLAVAEQLKQIHPNLQCKVAAADNQAAELIAQLNKQSGLGQTIAIETNKVDQVIRWSDVALIVSGTATLHAVAAGTPMVVVYNTGWWKWHLLGKWIIRTRTFALPNLVAEATGLGRVVPELVPHFGQCQPLILALERLLREPDLRRYQVTALAQIAQAFDGSDFTALTSGHILEAIDKSKAAFSGPS